MKLPVSGAHLGVRALFVALTIVLGSAVYPGQPVRAQEGAPPPGFGAAIDAALEASESWTSIS